MSDSESRSGVRTGGGDTNAKNELNTNAAKATELGAAGAGVLPAAPAAIAECPIARSMASDGTVLDLLEEGL